MDVLPPGCYRGRRYKLFYVAPHVHGVEGGVEAPPWSSGAVYQEFLKVPTQICALEREVVEVLGFTMAISCRRTHFLEISFQCSKVATGTMTSDIEWLRIERILP